jgi:serine/threonine-protein kinase RsbW
MRGFRRRYPSNYSSVPRARRDLASFARSCGLSTAEVNDLTLAAGEACNNAAEHGHVADGHFTVACSYDKLRGAVVVEVADAGRGFDPAGKGECLPPERLGMRGLGIFIMRSLMDDVCFSVTKFGTRVRLVKYLRYRPADGDMTPAAASNGRSDGRHVLGAVHDRLKTLLKLARVHPGGRRQP